jgi:23S rRNA pseudouridine1911/1915/1917 synthase
VHRKKMSTQARSHRRAVTRWQVLRRYDADRLTLVDLSLETGRTHQIRVHMAGINCPVVGDPLYGGVSRIKAFADQVLRQMVAGLERQFLHAWQLGFEHPNGQTMLFQADLPPELYQILSYLEGKYSYSLTDLKVMPRAGPSET